VRDFSVLVRGYLLALCSPPSLIGSNGVRSEEDTGQPDGLEMQDLRSKEDARPHAGKGRGGRKGQGSYIVVRDLR